MKKKVTLSELYAIGDNWLARRNRLIEASLNEDASIFYRMRAHCLSALMSLRLARVSLAINAISQKVDTRNLEPGGMRAEHADGDGEYFVPPHLVKADKLK